MAAMVEWTVPLVVLELDCISAHQRALRFADRIVQVVARYCDVAHEGTLGEHAVELEGGVHAIVSTQSGLPRPRYSSVAPWCFDLI